MTHSYHNLANANELGNNGLILVDTHRDRDFDAYQPCMDTGLPMPTTTHPQYDRSGSQSWVYLVSNTDQPCAWNIAQLNHLAQVPICNGTNYLTVEGYNVTEVSHTSAPYTGYDPHTFMAVPSGHTHMNLQASSGGYTQSGEQATSYKYLQHRPSQGHHTMPLEELQPQAPIDIF
ncbi:Zinc finger C2H2 [Penicillium concentricum]|uniref:Zinc finger C2H2 n=1 Tax=Penicillium concentricum TaxID=293559 RepID=A0A9W9VBS7_9EURO|nr:Zinc finger C2H2 [Penicillium concentricum]KAJ5374889.1 Zinc finger C2H2 [Penicillium concentricum]